MVTGALKSPSDFSGLGFSAIFSASNLHQTGSSSISENRASTGSSVLLSTSSHNVCMLLHGRVFCRFIEKVQQDIPGLGVKEQLQILCNIYSLSVLHKHLGDFLTTGCITPKQGSLANDQLRSLYSQIRPNAVALVDAFNYTDHYLGSVLGRYDGNAYPKLEEEAWKDPLNDSVVPDGYHEYIQPLLKQKLSLSRL